MKPLILLTLLAGLLHAGEIELRVMTFNLRWDGLDRGQNAWENRRPLALDLIREAKPDVVGLQEPSREQTRDLTEGLREYASFIGPHERDQHISLLYRHTRFTCDDSGSFWLVPESTLSGGTRRCAWIRLVETRTGQAFFAFNCHLDHRAPASRLQSADALLAGIAEIAGDHPFVLTGDFNAAECGKAMTALTVGHLADAFRRVNSAQHEIGTGHGFSGRTNGARIDYIFIPVSTQVRSCEILRFNREGCYPSDHFPVIAHIVLSRL